MSNIFNDPHLVYLITSHLTHDEFASAHCINRQVNNSYCDFLSFFHATLVHRKNHGSILVTYPDPEEQTLSTIDGRRLYEVDNVFGFVDGIILDCWDHFKVVHDRVIHTIPNDRSRIRDGETFASSSIWGLLMAVQSGGWVARRGKSLYYSNVEGIVYEMALSTPIDLSRNLIVDVHSDDYDDMSVSSERSITGYEPSNKKNRCM